MRIEASAAGIVLCVLLSSPARAAGGARHPAAERPNALAVTADGDFVVGGADVARLAPDGRRRWVTSLVTGEHGHKVELLRMTAPGDVVVVGTFDGELAIGSAHLHSAGRTDIFLAALSPEGAVRWSIAVGGPEDEQLADVAVRSDGGVVVSGAFSETMTVGHTALGSPGQPGRPFVAGFSPRGEPLWARALDPKARSLHLEAAGERIAFVTSFNGTVDLGAGPLTGAGAQTEAAFGLLDGTGKTLWSKRLGGPSWPAALAVDRQGNLLVSARTDEDIQIGDRWIRIDACSQDGAVLASFSSEGALRWARGWGTGSGVGDDVWIAVDRAGRILVGADQFDLQGTIRWEGSPRELPADKNGGGLYALTFTSDGRPGRGVFAAAWETLTLTRAAIAADGTSYLFARGGPASTGARRPADVSEQLGVGETAVLRVAPASKIEESARDEERAAARRFPWLARRPGWVTSPPGRASIDFGQSLTYLGDVDGDHLGDVAIGAPRSGAAWIYFGGAKGFRKSPTALRPPPGTHKDFGARVTALGDLNADGRPDLAVLSGVPTEPGGRLAVYFGAAGGPSPDPGWVMPPLKAKETPAAVEAADLDGDGARELIVGVPQARKGRGRVLVYRGGPTGPSTTPAWTLDGPKPEASFGAAFAVCDVNHDGIADLIVGAPGTEPEEGGPDAGRTGAVYLYLGGKSGLSQTSAWSYQSHAEWFGLGDALACPGDVDGDGRPDLIVAHPWSEIEGGDVWTGQVHLFPGTGAGFVKEPTWSVDIDRHGATIVPAGDVNGDGLADFLIGVWPTYPMLADARVELYLGGRSGPAKAADWSVGSRQDGFAVGLASGDVNGDGVADVVVGDPEHPVCARHASGGGQARLESTEHGQVDVYLGHR